MKKIIKKYNFSTYLVYTILFDLSIKKIKRIGGYSFYPKIKAYYIGKYGDTYIIIIVFYI